MSAREEHERAFNLLGTLNALRVLDMVLGDDTYADMHEVTRQAMGSLVPGVVFGWQTLSDDAQARFLAEHPEHSAAVPAFLAQFAEVTGVDLAQATVDTRAAEEHLREWDERRREGGEGVAS